VEKKPVIKPDGRPWTSFQAPSEAVNQSYPQHNQGYLQLSHMTKPERFPLIFDSAKEIHPNAKRILSFGCSTGEECLAMATRFPNAEVVGIDIDHQTILAARRKNKHPDRVFFHDLIGATGKYDVALALMVFFQMDAPIKYLPWHRCLCDIDAHLNVGGLLMLYTSEFNFMQAAPAENYEIVREWTRKHNRNEKEYFCGYYRKIKDSDKKPEQEEIEIASLDLVKSKCRNNTRLAQLARASS
jgi:2-polyprenyl-3-methyl-5-hydroxy-6-metoxy-1,4-benzoquinol methylase